MKQGIKKKKSLLQKGELLLQGKALSGRIQDKVRRWRRKVNWVKSQGIVSKQIRRR